MHIGISDVNEVKSSSLIYKIANESVRIATRMPHLLQESQAIANSSINLLTQAALLVDINERLANKLYGVAIRNIANLREVDKKPDLVANIGE